MEEEGGYVEIASIPPTLVRRNYPQQETEVAFTWAAHGTARTEGRGDMLSWETHLSPTKGQKVKKGKIPASRSRSDSMSPLFS